MTKQKSEYSIQTVTNAFRILEAFDEQPQLGVSELSRLLELHKNNVFRLLATLEQRHYIEQCADDDRYRLGARCLQLGRSYKSSHTLLRRGRPVLERLAREMGETAHLATLFVPPAEDEDDRPGPEGRRFEVVHLDGEQPRRQLLVGLRISDRLLPHTCALGKVLLGCADEETRQRYHRRDVARGLEARTEATIRDGDKLIEHLRTVATERVALDLEEFETGVRCVAAPVYDGQGAVVAAISVSGPSVRLSVDDLHGEAARRVGAAAEALSADLGYAAG